jgi:hypothetical protein
VGGHHPEVIRLFRDVEKRAVGVEASAVRTQARERQRLARTNQPSLFPPAAPEEDTVYARLHCAGLEETEAFLRKVLSDTSTMKYASLWPQALQACHISEADLKEKLWQLKERGEIAVLNLGRARSLKDDHVVRLARRG